MSDFIPAADADAVAHGLNAITYATANLIGLGLTLAQITPLTNTFNAFQLAFNQSIAQQAVAASGIQVKDVARANYETKMRDFNALIQASPNITPAQKAALGFTVPDTEPSPTAVPTTHPVGEIESGQRLRHVIHFRDQLTPTSRAKPAGIMGCEIWQRVGGTGTPTDATEFEFLALDTRTPYMVDFEGAEAGQTAYYFLRWVNTRGDKGPWSPLMSATVGG